MLTVAVCDDEETQLNEVRSAMQEFASRTAGIKFSIKCFQSAVELLDDADKNGCPDIALLDICMPSITGIQAAKELSAINPAIKIIFLTNSKEFAVEAFEVNAVHYLLKPFTQEKFDVAINRAVSLFTDEGAKRISINGKGETATMLDISEIEWIESLGYNRHVHTPHGELIETRRTLSQFAQELEKLSPEQFIMPYRGYIVNLDAVRTITPKNIQMKDGSVILIKLGDFRELKEKLFRYTFTSNFS